MGDAKARGARYGKKGVSVGIGGACWGRPPPPASPPTRKDAGFLPPQTIVVSSRFTKEANLTQALSSRRLFGFFCRRRVARLPRSPSHSHAYPAPAPKRRRNVGQVSPSCFPQPRRLCAGVSLLLPPDTAAAAAATATAARATASSRRARSRGRDFFSRALAPTRFAGAHGATERRPTCTRKHSSGCPPPRRRCVRPPPPPPCGTRNDSPQTAASPRGLVRWLTYYRLSLALAKHNLIKQFFNQQKIINTFMSRTSCLMKAPTHRVKACCAAKFTRKIYFGVSNLVNLCACWETQLLPLRPPLFSVCRLWISRRARLNVTHSGRAWSVCKKTMKGVKCCQACSCEMPLEG